MNFTKIFMTFLFVLGLGSQAQAGEYKLFDMGTDGNEHYYRVSCQDPFSQGDVVVIYEEQSVPRLNNRSTDRPTAEGDGLPPKRNTSSTGITRQLPGIEEICISDANGETQCRKRWSVAAAAQTICK